MQWSSEPALSKRSALKGSVKCIWFVVQPLTWENRPTSNGEEWFNLQRSMFNVESHVVIARSGELVESDEAISGLTATLPEKLTHAKHAKAAKKSAVLPKTK